jgi:predicted transcriptional regulator
MPRISTTLKGETFTFRLDPTLKEALTRLAVAEHMQPAELMRNLVRRHVAEKERHAFEIEARRQSLAIALRASDLGSDEAQVMREIETDIEHNNFADEWRA